MLPDWPETKERIAGAFLRVIRAETHARLGFLAEIRETTVHEGDRTAISRADGSHDEQGFTQIGAEMRITEEDFAKLSIPEMLERLSGVAEKLAQRRSEHAFSVFGAACAEAGNVVDAGGGAFTAELLLDTLETMELGFDGNGALQIPSILINPTQDEALRRELVRLDSEPELRSRADGIVRRKREDWLAREADRNLVG